MFQCVVREDNSGTRAYACGCEVSFLRCPSSKPEPIKSFKKYLLGVVISFDNSVLKRFVWVELLNPYSLFTHKILNLGKYFIKPLHFSHSLLPENDLTAITFFNV